MEGIFIFRPKLKITFNYRIYLEVDASVALTRFEERRCLKEDDWPVEIFEDNWVRAHNRYVSEINPKKRDKMNGGAMEDRTPDLRIANATLYQLSYDPTHANATDPRCEGRA